MEKSTLPNAAHLFWFLFASQFARVVAPIYHFTAATQTQADVTMMLCAAVVVGKRGIMGKSGKRKETRKREKNVTGARMENFPISQMFEIPLCECDVIRPRKF